MNIKLQTNEQLSATVANGLAGVFINGVSLSASLSSASGKVYFDNRISDITGSNDLSVVRLSADEYAQMLDGGACLSNAIYIVEAPNIDAFKQQIKNVAPPTDLSDAATKEYVDNAFNNVQIPTDLSSFTNSPGYLSAVPSAYALKNDIQMSYHQNEHKIVLSAGTNTTSVDCTDFIKDGMLSSAELCGTQLVLNFNTDAGSDPISVELSNFVDNYDSKIETLSDAIDKKIFIQNNISSISGYSDLSVVKLSADEYTTLLTSNQLLSNALYVVEDDYVDAYGEQIKNVAYPTDLSDAATKGYVDTALANVQIPADLSAFTNSPGYLVSNDISDYYKKSETSSAVEIGNAIVLSAGNKIYIDDRISSTSGYSDLSIIRLSASEYENLPQEQRQLSNALYVVEDDTGDNHGKQIKNLAPGTDLSDAVNLEQLSNAISSIQIPADLSAFTNSPGYLVSNDISDYCKKTETSSAAEISNALSAKADVSSLDFSKVILSANSISSKIDDLVINSITKAEYDAMLSAGTLCSNQLYSIDSLQLDARGDWIVNVKTPDLSSDAANKAYVDSQLSNAGGGYAFDIYNPPLDSVNNMYVLKPGKFNILSNTVGDGCVLVLENYDKNQIYKVKLSSDPSNVAHIQLLVDDNSTTESPGAYSKASLNNRIDWLSPDQTYVFEVSYGNVVVNDDYNGDSLVSLKPFETYTEPIDQYDPGETLYHLLPVDNAVNYLSALTGNRTYNLHMPPAQTVNGVRRMRQFKLVPSSAGFGEVGATLSILNTDITGSKVSFRYKTDRAHACAPLSGEALTFIENKKGTFDVNFEDEVNFDEIDSRISNILSNTLPGQLSSKQDKLTDAQISAIDEHVGQRATVVTFTDNTVSSFNIVGVLTQAIKNSWGKNPKSVKIGTSVTSIGDWVFGYCSDLTSVMIPASVMSIGGAAFNSCSDLTSVMIPASVMSIGNAVFGGCSNLTSIVFKNRLSSEIPSGAPWSAPNQNLQITTWNAASLEQLSGLEQLSSKQDKLADAQLSDIDYIPHLKPENTVVVFTDGTVSSFNVNGINSNTVQSWGKEPKSIKIGTNCTQIGGGFKDKTSLTSITFAEERTTELIVRYQAFQNTGITSIVIPEFVKFQDYGNIHHQFSYCQNLKEVIYKGSSINNTFAYSPNLTSIAFTDNLKYIGSTIFYGNQNLKYISIPNSVTAIEKSAFFSNTGLTSIVLPEKIHDIKDSIFSVCSSLASIAIPSEVSSIYAQAFQGCSSLTSIDIPDSVKRIGIDTVMPTNQGKPFGNCVNLSNVTVGTGVTDIISNAFDNCVNLTSIVFRNRLSSEIPSGAPWGATNATVSTWNDASQEWVNEQIPYKFNEVSATSYALKDYTVNYYEFANDVSSVTFSMPTATSSYVADFLLDVKNSNASDSTIEFDSLDTSFKLVVKENDDLVGMTTIAPNEMARFYITQTGFQLSGLPTFEISKKVVVEATA